VSRNGSSAPLPPADAVVDCLGLTCPVPMMETAKRIRELQPGQVLLLLSDDPATIDDLVAWCHLTGHEYLGNDPVDSHARIRVRKRLIPARRSPLAADESG